MIIFIIFAGCLVSGILLSSIKENKSEIKIQTEKIKEDIAKRREAFLIRKDKYESLSEIEKYKYDINQIKSELLAWKALSFILCAIIFILGIVFASIYKNEYFLIMCSIFPAFLSYKISFQDSFLIHKMNNDNGDKENNKPNN
ncbi:MAG: hypothetical protein FWG90_01715 [Oscillospiraceae bacterium]|nr:hypothetical protein [Oscillospiraceae bacterium]